jgi:hypothetical protein
VEWGVVHLKGKGHEGYSLQVGLVGHCLLPLVTTKCGSSCWADQDRRSNHQHYQERC